MIRMARTNKFLPVFSENEEVLPFPLDYGTFKNTLKVLSLSESVQIWNVTNLSLKNI